MRDYSTEIFAVYKRTEYMREEVLWKDFITAFRPHTLRVWTPPMLVEWKELLLDIGIHLYSNRERQRVELIIDILYRKSHQPRISTEKLEDEGRSKMGKEKESNNPSASRKYLDKQPDE